jgi:hypothetical protein
MGKRYASFLPICILLGFVTAFGQGNFTKCKVEDKKLESVRYYIGNVERSRVSDSKPAALLVDISVKANKINRDDLTLIANHLKQTFCKEDNLIVGIFDRKDTAKYFDANLQSARNHFRGEYILNRIIGEDYVSYTTVADYNGNYKNRIKMDLR